MDIKKMVASLPADLKEQVGVKAEQYYKKLEKLSFYYT